MIPAACAQTPAAPQRFWGGFVPHGAAPGYWIPEAEGALPEKLPYVWSALEPYKEHLTILTGLAPARIHDSRCLRADTRRTAAFLGRFRSARRGAGLLDT